MDKSKIDAIIAQNADKITTINSKPMTWEEIKKTYPHQVVGLTSCEPNDINFKTAVVKYTDATTPYDIMELLSLSEDIFMISTSIDDNSNLILFP